MHALRGLPPMVIDDQESRRAIGDDAPHGRSRSPSCEDGPAPHAPRDLPHHEPVTADPACRPTIDEERWPPWLTATFITAASIALWAAIIATARWLLG